MLDKYEADSICWPTATIHIASSREVMDQETQFGFLILITHHHKRKRNILSFNCFGFKTDTFHIFLYLGSCSPLTCDCESMSTAYVYSSLFISSHGSWLVSPAYTLSPCWQTLGIGDCFIAQSVRHPLPTSQLDSVAWTTTHHDLVPHRISKKI